MSSVYGTQHKRTLVNNLCNFEICLVGRYFWHLCEMSEFCIVRDELVLILLVLHGRETGMVLKVVEKWVFWINPGNKGQ